MARRNYSNHVGGTIGDYEGCGASTDSKVWTCVPGWGSSAEYNSGWGPNWVLVADATARRGGKHFRVRAWKRR